MSPAPSVRASPLHPLSEFGDDPPQIATPALDDIPLGEDGEFPEPFHEIWNSIFADVNAPAEIEEGERGRFALGSFEWSRPVGNLSRLRFSLEMK